MTDPEREMCDEAMSSAVATAVISGLVALAVAGLSAVLTWAQFQRERNKWLIDVKVAWTLELLRTRLASYPTAHSVMAPLSSYADEPATAETARRVARDLTTWLYSAGGLCADAKARSAVIAVRDCCHSWGRGGGAQPPELFALRDVAINFLRLDLELVGLTSAVDDQSTALDKLGEELRRLDIYKDRRGEQSTDRN